MWPDLSPRDPIICPALHEYLSGRSEIKYTANIFNDFQGNKLMELVYIYFTG